MEKKFCVLYDDNNELLSEILETEKCQIFLNETTRIKHFNTHNEALSFIKENLKSDYYVVD